MKSAVPVGLRESIEAVSDLEHLCVLLKRAILCAGLAEFDDAIRAS
jgi:hypothetical protein